MLDLTSKLCNKCSTVRSLEAFSVDARSSDGLQCTCKDCNKEYRIANSKTRKTYFAQYRLDNIQAERDRTARYRTNNPDSVKVNNHKYYEGNKQAILEKGSQYRKNNPGLRAYYEAKRRAAKLQRTPIWSETAEIIEFYKNCPEGYHVDHIIPLQGDKYGVCGLHVIGNLQYLTPEENSRKHNKFCSEEHFWVYTELKVA